MTAACSGAGSEVTSTTTSAPATTSADLGAALEDLIADVGLLITLLPGTGLGAEAEQLLRDAGPEALPGTANHVATASTPGGPVGLVTYQGPVVAGRGDGQLTVCVAEIRSDGSNAACSRRPNQEPEVGMFLMTVAGPGERNSIGVYGGAEAAFAIVVTDKQARIGVTTVGGWAYAHWPAALGGPASIAFYDGDANQLYGSSYDLE